MASISKGIGYFRLLSDLFFIYFSFFLAVYISNRNIQLIDWYLSLLLAVTWYFSRGVYRANALKYSAQYLDKEAILSRFENLLKSAVGINNEQ